MSMIRPSSDLRNKYGEISDFCNKYNEPVFITKNGHGDVVILSNEQYEILCGKQELQRLLNIGIEEARANKGRLAQDVFDDIRKFLDQ